MGGFKDCAIHLDNPWNTYYCGQTVGGRADIVLDAPKKIRGVYVTIKGESETAWTVQKSRQRDGKTHHYTERLSGNEEYFKISYYLFGSKSGSEIELPAGTHTYNFTCALPPSLPSSFEGEHGFIRYTVKVTIDRPWKFDHETKMAFTVISPLDLNLNPAYKEPFRIQIEDTLCCCWCKSGPLSVDIVAPISGYCSGQCIPFHIECENLSSATIDKIKVVLRKKVVFRTQTPYADTKESTATIGEFKVGPVAQNAQGSYDMLIEIPPLPPSNLVNCGIIDLDYDILVEAYISGWHCNLDETKSITIGTVPLVGFQSPPPPQGSKQPGEPNMPPQGGPLQPLIPPSYPNQGDPNQGGFYPPPQNTPYPSPAGGNSPYPPPAGGNSPYPPPAGGNSPYPPPAGGNSPYPPPAGGNSPYPPSTFPQPSTEGGIGWNLNPSAPQQAMYPQLAAPSFRKSPYGANEIKDSTDNEHTRISGKSDFAPYYPTYAYNPDIIPPSQQQ